MSTDNQPSKSLFDDLQPGELENPKTRGAIGGFNNTTPEQPPQNQKQTPHEPPPKPETRPTKKKTPNQAGKPPRHRWPKYQMFAELIAEGQSVDDAWTTSGISGPSRRAYAIVQRDESLRDVLRYLGTDPDTITPPEPPARKDQEPEADETGSDGETPPEQEDTDAGPLTDEDLETLITGILRRRKDDLTGAEAKALIDALQRIRPDREAQKGSDTPDLVALAQYVSSYAGYAAEQLVRDYPDGERLLLALVMRWAGWTPGRLAELAASVTADPPVMA